MIDSHSSLEIPNINQITNAKPWFFDEYVDSWSCFKNQEFEVLLFP